MVENEDDLLVFDDFELDNEDVSSSILKVKEKDPTVFYIEFDVFTREITEISPVEITQPRSFRHGVFMIESNDIIKKLLSAKIPASKVKVKFDPTTNLHDLVSDDKLIKKPYGEYFFVQNKKDLYSPIHLDCDLILKKIKVVLNIDEYKKYISSHNTDEQEIKIDNDIKFYCFNDNNPTLLYGGFTIKSDELLANQEITVSCKWLPDQHHLFEKYSFIHKGANFNISYGMLAPELVSDKAGLERPQILYKQQGTVLLLQSIMNSAANYKIQDTVNFYCYKRDNPTHLLSKFHVTKKELEKFNQFSVKLKTNETINILSDHDHLYIEDSNVSTYYKF